MLKFYITSVFGAVECMFYQDLRENMKPFATGRRSGARSIYTREMIEECMEGIVKKIIFL